MNNLAGKFLSWAVASHKLLSTNCLAGEDGKKAPVAESERVKLWRKT